MRNFTFCVSAVVKRYPLTLKEPHFQTVYYIHILDIPTYKGANTYKLKLSKKEKTVTLLLDQALSYLYAKYAAAYTLSQ